MNGPRPIFCAAILALAWGASCKPVNAQNMALNPTYGTRNLTATSRAQDVVLDLESGGNINANALGQPCVGFIANAPDYRVNYRPGSHSLTFAVTSNFDTTLVINGPDGRWYCDDDGGGGSNPVIRFSTPGAGQYDIWVGTYGEARLRPARLRVTEVASASGRREAERAETARRREEERRLREEAERQRQEEERQQLAAEREARRTNLTTRFGAEQAALIIAGEVRTGMSGEAVREALGAPRRIERVAPGEEMWIYDSIRLVLLSDRVTFIRR